MISKADQFLSSLPSEWSHPSAEVIDTAKTIHLFLKEWDINSPELLLGLTELVLKRHDNYRDELASLTY
jgi:hypothetical protein